MSPFFKGRSIKSQFYFRCPLWFSSHALLTKIIVNHNRRSFLSYLKRSKKKTLKILSRATKNTRKNVQGELEFKPLNFWWRLWFSGLLWRFSLRSSTCFLMQNSLFQLYSFTSRVNTNFLTGQNYSNISSERNSFNLFTFSRIYFETHVEIREILFWSRLVEF